MKNNIFSEQYDREALVIIQRCINHIMHRISSSQEPASEETLFKNDGEKLRYFSNIVGLINDNEQHEAATILHKGKTRMWYPGGKSTPYTYGLVSFIAHYLGNSAAQDMGKISCERVAEDKKNDDNPTKKP